MSLARPLWRASQPRLSLSGLFRSASTATKQQTARDNTSRQKAPRDNASRNTAKPQPKARGFYLSDVRTFIRHPANTLMTTPAMLHLMREYNVSHENGQMPLLRVGSDLSRMLPGSVQVAFSPQHIIKPTDLKYFTPRDHPLAAQARERYRTAATEQPLWFHVTALGQAPAVVRAKCRSRVKREVLAGMAEMGYDAVGRAPALGREIRGTLWICIYDCVKVANLDVSKMGRMLARDLVKNHSQPMQRPAPTPRLSYKT